MKKILALLLVALMVIGMFAGCQEAGGNKSQYKVAMVTDYGDITDQSFNQTTWDAVKAFGEANKVDVKYYKPTTNDTAGRVASVELAIADG